MDDWFEPSPGWNAPIDIKPQRQKSLAPKASSKKSKETGGIGMQGIALLIIVLICIAVFAYYFFFSSPQGPPMETLYAQGQMPLGWNGGGGPWQGPAQGGAMPVAPGGYPMVQPGGYYPAQPAQQAWQAPSAPMVSGAPWGQAPLPAAPSAPQAFGGAMDLLRNPAFRSVA